MSKATIQIIDMGRVSRRVCKQMCYFSLVNLLCIVSILAQGDDLRKVGGMRDWTHIIIHHSATETGTAAAFDAAHRARGMENGLAYHFVINNGRSGTVDGSVEQGNRWKRQIAGGHCRQTEINEQGIGICLVGDFTGSRPTPKQMDSLVKIVRRLQEQFQIPDENVLGHGDVLGENSECPGDQFPWDDLWVRLKDHSQVQTATIETH